MKNTVIEVALHGQHVGTNVWRTLQSERGQHRRERVPAGVQERPAEPGRQRGERPDGVCQSRAARAGCAADLRRGIRSPRVASGAAGRLRLTRTAGSSPTSSRVTAGRHGQPGCRAMRSTPAGWSGASFSPCASRGFDAGGPVSDELLPGEPVSPLAAALNLVDDDSYTNYQACSCSCDGGTAEGLSLNMNYTLSKTTGDHLGRQRDAGSMNYRTLRDRSLDDGPLAVRRAPRPPGCSAPTICRSARIVTSLSATPCSMRIVGGWTTRRDAQRRSRERRSA